MAEKLLKTGKRKMVAKADAAGGVRARREPKKVVLVGTYAGDQLKEWPGYYPYPLYGDDKIDATSTKKVNEIWLSRGRRSLVISPPSVWA